MAPEESPPRPGLAEFKPPWVTFALLIILVAVFTFENMFPLAPGKELAPSIRTLFGMGALSRTAVLSGASECRSAFSPRRSCTRTSRILQVQRGASLGG